MKKLATTFGLFTLMLLVTSFTTPTEIGGGRSSQTTLEPLAMEIGGGRSSQTTLEPLAMEIGGGRSSQTTLEP